MNTSTQSAAVADPASSHRDDPGPSTARPHTARSADQDADSGDAAASDAEPPEPAGKKQGDFAIKRSGDLEIGHAADHPMTPSPDHQNAKSPDDAITIDIADDVTHAIDFLWLDGHLRRIATHLPRPIERVSIRIVGDLEMTDLNRRFHDADETTDVLTFHDPATGDSVNADLALCADEASRQAGSRGNAIERELLLYALHGLLHCCGFDDTEDESFAAMHAEEDRILVAIGVGATFVNDADDAQMGERRP